MVNDREIMRWSNTGGLGAYIARGANVSFVCWITDYLYSRIYNCEMQNTVHV